jgi:HAD superfamily hydrolase (TIGR01509 family)
LDDAHPALRDHDSKVIVAAVGAVAGDAAVSIARPVATPAAVIFDNDGLLLDTESVWTRAESDLFARRGREFTLAHKQALVGTSAQIAGGLLAGQLGEPGRELELVAELDELVFVELERGVEPMAGALELVAELRQLAIPTGLVSNSPARFIARALELVGLEGRFDVIVSGHEVAAPKPAPDAYLAACERLGIDPGPEVVALEDSPTGVAAGRAAGLTVIGVPSLPGVELDHAHEVVDSLSAGSLRDRLGLA